MNRTLAQINPERVVIYTSVVLFLTVPFLSSTVLGNAIDSLLGRILLVSFLLYGITLGPLPGVLSFLAVASIFAERNRLAIYRARAYIIGRGSPPTLGQMTPHSMPAPVNGEIKDKPWIEYPNMEGSFIEDDSWNPLPKGESEDEKGVLESQLYPNDLQDRFYVRNGLAPPKDPDNPNTA